MATFSYEDTFSKVADIIADKLGIDKKTITTTSTLQDLGADSLDLVEIIMKMEEQFGIEISDEDAEKMNNLDEVVKYIQQKRSK
jgi:acyl carrier protein